MISSGKEVRCDQPWTEWLVGKEMTRHRYDVRRDLIFVAHPELRIVELGPPAPQDEEEEEHLEVIIGKYSIVRCFNCCEYD